RHWFPNRCASIVCTAPMTCTRGWRLSCAAKSMSKRPRFSSTSPGMTGSGWLRSTTRHLFGWFRDSELFLKTDHSGYRFFGPHRNHIIAARAPALDFGGQPDAHIFGFVFVGEYDDIVILTTDGCGGHSLAVFG